jgi:uncharacterized protein YbjT (DUF2867 family)
MSEHPAEANKAIVRYEAFRPGDVTARRRPGQGFSQGGGMKIAVFGSTGGNGRLILDEAMRRGHEVTAFARRGGALAGVAGLAAVVEGDGRDRADVEKAVAGQRVVIMTVTGRGEPGVAADIARAVIAAMAAHGVSRLVTTSSYGMVATRPYVLASLVRRAFRAAFADQDAADQVIKASDLDWTILRATRLTPGPASRPPRLSTGLFTTRPYSLARAAYAASLVDLAGRERHPCPPRRQHHRLTTFASLSEELMTNRPERRSTKTAVKTWPRITPATGRSFRRTLLPGSTWKRSSRPAGRHPSRL